MFEKVNKFHPDKVADRIAGALVDLAYGKQSNPKIAVEVLIGHGLCTIIAETSVDISEQEAREIVTRIAGECELRLVCVQQDEYLAKNQDGKIRCGDNGIFRGCPVTDEQKSLTRIAKALSYMFESDGKYIMTDSETIVCQSNMETKYKDILLEEGSRLRINPLGFWKGGLCVDAGATNRKLGSDMGDAVTGGGLHGKDLSKADVSVNIYCHILSQEKGLPVSASCAIGDEIVRVVCKDGEHLCIEYPPYEKIVNAAREYIRSLGGFEALAEWGLIR